MTDTIASLRVALARRYEIQRELGKGSFATVYLARDLRHERRVAIKVLRIDPSTDAGELRFVREIRFLARLQHPNILPLHDSGHVEDMLYYVMPYVTGESLRQRMDRDRKLPVGDAVCFAREIADALSYAHRNDVVHRDIKPENILLSGSHAIIADFGIARALHESRGVHLTRTGLGGPGTPAYMSPEQMLGSHDALDGRSDIYSLGCVLYEMLAGEPPFAGKGGFARRFTEPPPPISALRSGVPAGVENALVRALDRDPARRFGDAALFAEALTVSVAPGTCDVPDSAHPPASRGVGVGASPADASAAESIAGNPRATLAPAAGTGSSSSRWRGRMLQSLSGRRRRWAWALASTIVVAAGLSLVLTGGRAEGVSVSSEAFVVLPFAERSAGRRPPLSGGEARMLVHDGLARWTELKLVSPMRVNDAVGSQPPNDVREALRTARGLGAGTLVWGEIAQRADSFEVRAALYDVEGGDEAVVEHSMRIPMTMRDVRGRFAELADSLLMGKPTSKAAVAGAAGTRSLAAWRAYSRGHQALATWDIVAAEKEFRAATELDPEFAHAYLWLAQLGSWRVHDADYGDDGSGVFAAAAQAWGRRAQLTERDAAVAAALLALAEDRYPDACARYGEIVAKDSLDFTGWYGLGECNSRDRIVVRDERSPSGWRFRGSYRSAAVGYERALQLVPSLHLLLDGAVFDWLKHLLVTDRNHYRPGASIDKNSFLAFPSLDHDTLAFVPYPFDRARLNDPGTRPGTQGAAIDQNRSTLRRMALRWTEAVPEDAAAWEALALVLESAVDLDAASATLGRARSLAVDPVRRLRLAAADVRVRIKLGEFVAAYRLIDSLLAANPSATSLNADLVAALAMLVGRPHTASGMLGVFRDDYEVVLSEGTRVTLAPALADPALAMRAYAAMGAPVDSIRAIRRAIERRLRSYVADADHDAVHAAILARPMSQAFPEVGFDAAEGIDPTTVPLLAMQQMLGRGQGTEVRRRLGAIRATRSSRIPGSISIDATFAEAVLLVALGDSAEAAAYLDATLDALPAINVRVLDHVETAGPLVRAMALRAELAHAAGDRPTARRWAAAVATLWADPDDPMRPALGRMHRILAEPT
ncbi:MAG: protein kinase domain-containing protein [Gemmatimonadaceae bacterium]